MRIEGMVGGSHGSKLAIELARGFHLLRTYPLRHPTVQDVIRDLERILEEGDEAVKITLEDDELFADGEPVPDRHGHVGALTARMEKLGVGALTITPDVAGADFERILDVLHDSSAVTGAGSFSGAVTAAGGSRVEIGDRPVGSSAGSAAPAGVDPSPRSGGSGGSGGDEGLVVGREDSMFEQMRRKDFEDVDLDALARSYVEAGGEDREEIGRRLSEVATEHRQRVESEELAGALEVLAGAITDDVPRSERQELFELVVELATPGAVDLLVERLGAAARDPQRRAELVHVLSRIGVDAARSVADALAEANDRMARRAYLETLVEFGQTHGMSLVEGMLDDGRWFVVRNAVTIVGEVGGSEAIGYLTPALAHDDARVRKEAVSALSKIGGADAEALIVGVLTDPDPGVRGAAALALGVHKVGRAVRPLTERLEEESDEDVQVEILRALGRLGDASAVPAVEKKTTGGLFSKPPKRVRIAAIRALGSIGTPHARSVLERAANERDPDVSEAAKAAL